MLEQVRFYAEFVGCGLLGIEGDEECAVCPAIEASALEARRNRTVRHRASGNLILQSDAIGRGVPRVLQWCRREQINSELGRIHVDRVCLAFIGITKTKIEAPFVSEVQ